MLTSVIITPCASVTETGRLIESFQDVAGTGIVTWTLNNGNLPANVNMFEVYANGKRLDYPAEYTLAQNVGTATVSIAFPAVGVYYTMIMYP